MLFSNPCSPEIKGDNGRNDVAPEAAKPMTRFVALTLRPFCGRRRLWSLDVNRTETWPF